MPPKEFMNNKQCGLFQGKVLPYQLSATKRMRIPVVMVI